MSVLLCNKCNRLFYLHHHVCEDAEEVESRILGNQGTAVTPLVDVERLNEWLETKSGKLDTEITINMDCGEGDKK